MPPLMAEFDAETTQRTGKLFAAEDNDLSLVVGRRSVHLKGELRQGLAAFTAAGYGEANGELALPFTIESGALRVFHFGADIDLMNEENTDPVLSWTLSGAKPMKYTGATLNAKTGTDVAIEELTLSVEKLEVS